MTYQPVVGDRVRATRVVEGEVTASHDGEYALVEVMVASGGQWELYGEDGWSFEKLQEPEPTWVNGDVIEVVYDLGGRYQRPRKAVRVSGRWVLTDSGETPGQHFTANHWPEDVKILYKS